MNKQATCIILMWVLFISACNSTEVQPPPTPQDLREISIVESINLTPIVEPSPTFELTLTITAEPSLEATVQPPATETTGPTTTTLTSTPVPVTTSPTNTATISSNSPTPSPTWSVLSTAVSPTEISALSPTPTIMGTPSEPCSERFPDDSLLTLISKTYGISEEYEPSDLVSVNDYLPFRVTLGIQMQLREVALDPLIELISDMEAVGLSPRVESGYRSAFDQAIAYAKWQTLYPDRVDLISALPGHSEHQLGTTVDFTSPELPGLTGDPEIRFHPFFSQTSEGIWLAENAHKYGYTLSYPLEAFEATGFNFEPWHFRYIGVELATRLHQIGISFTEFQLINQSPPCNPNE